jgi:hypothetical protein
MKIKLWPEQNHDVTITYKANPEFVKEQPHLEDVALIFHEPDCPGVITSDDTGKLRCAECGRQVGQLEPAVLADLLGLLKPPGPPGPADNQA